MSLMLRPSHTHSAVRPTLQKRRFRLVRECIECEHPSTTTLVLVDEPGDPASINDFYTSGILERTPFDCERCGCDHGIIVETAYLKAPNEERGEV